jgi:hypothetical protein
MICPQCEGSGLSAVGGPCMLCEATGEVDEVTQRVVFDPPTVPDADAFSRYESDYPPHDLDHDELSPDHPVVGRLR